MSLHKDNMSYGQIDKSRSDQRPPGYYERMAEKSLRFAIIGIVLIIAAIPLYFLLQPGHCISLTELETEKEYEIGQTYPVRVWGYISSEDSFWWDQAIFFSDGKTNIILSDGSHHIRCEIDGDVRDQYHENDWIIVEGIWDPGLFTLGDMIDVTSVEHFPNLTWIAWLVGGIGALLIVIWFYTIFWAIPAMKQGDEVRRMMKKKEESSGESDQTEEHVDSQYFMNGL